MNTGKLRLLVVALASIAGACGERSQAPAADTPRYTYPAFFDHAVGSRANPLGAPAAAYFCTDFTLPDPANLPLSAIRFGAWEREPSSEAALQRPLSIHREELASSFYPDIPLKNEYETQAEYQVRLAEAVAAWNEEWGGELSVVAGMTSVRDWEARPVWNETWGKFGLEYDAERRVLVHDVYPTLDTRSEHSHWDYGVATQVVTLRVVNGPDVARNPVSYAIDPDAARARRANIVLVLHGRVAIDPAIVRSSDERLDFEPLSRDSEIANIPFRVESADIRDICTGEIYASVTY